MDNPGIGSATEEPYTQKAFIIAFKSLGLQALLDE
jgi:hypothetical protein